MRITFSRRRLFIASAISAIVLQASEVHVGTARAEVTPELPIQLAGYQQRTSEATTR